MLKMKLPMKSATEEGGGGGEEDEAVDDDLETAPICPPEPRLLPGGCCCNCRLNEPQDGRQFPCTLDKETVFEWFGLCLCPAKRIELMCGLLHMCQPLELRFLGSCLEDLARKDFHVLRDWEIRANSPSEMGLLTDVSDPVVRSKLLVCLSLLSSESRECASILFRTLSRVENTSLTRNFGTTGDVGISHQQQQMSLLFTMASLHPAFPFHQREGLRNQFETLERTMETERRQYPASGSRVMWPDSPKSSINQANKELEDFLSKLPKELSTECFEKGILRLLSHRDEWEIGELEQKLRKKFSSASQAFRQRDCSFFLSNSSDAVHNHNLEPFMLCHRKKQGSKSPSLSIPNSKCPGLEGLRMQHSEHNGLLEWKKKSYSLKSSTEHCTMVSDMQLSGGKKKMKPQTDRDKGKKGESRISNITNGTLRSAPEQSFRSCSAKGPRLETGSGPDTCGETSSESYSSPSSPRHDCRESFESEDDKDRDSDSNSEGSGKDRADGFLPFSIGGPASAAVGRLVTPVLKEDGQRPESPLSASKFTQLSFMPPIQSVIQNVAPKPEGVVPPQIVDGKSVGLMVTVPPALSSMRDTTVSPTATGDTDKQHLDSNSSITPTFISSQPGLVQQPNLSLHQMIQRFKMTAPNVPQSTSENCNTPQHPAPVGAINVVSPNLAYVPPIQMTVGFPSAEPLASGTPHSLSHSENSGATQQMHSKPPGLPLSAGLPTPPPSFGLSVPSSVLPAQAGHAQTTGQVQTMVPPAVPTHTPGPAPSPSPALTHSTAQSNSTSYINSNGGSNGSPQQPSTQQLGCGACGCRGSCGSHPPNYYFPPPHRQVFSLPPLFHLTCNSSYLNQAHQSNGATQLPFFPPTQHPYANGPLLHTHTDHLLGNQTNYGIQQMTAFGCFYSPVYPSVSMVPNPSGTGIKKNGNISCYNCGASGHYAQDCKQPSIDASQQGRRVMGKETDNKNCMLFVKRDDKKCVKKISS
ncbi:zinc finger CCHC domain-containing protein 2 isoform X1 [Erpetoichthys calabaricus]|uniref:zinc finger CCHC domain-containing protein 2 isoform X1 n=1 Tax=Erpetoichthys calabaricus TaxID=27687 RepID=UPI00109FABCF|nr:zinc finger CCHC domain-containing protein 2 isoform X1 [Erpetoichthys calabaricus]